MFDSTLPPPPVVLPPEEVIDCWGEDRPVGPAEPVRWSEYLPDGLLADLLAQPSEVASEHRELKSLERIGGWERVIAWAQAQQLREMTSFMDRAEARNTALGACTSQAHDSAVAEVGLMLRVSARTAASRVNDAYSLCTQLPGTLAALEAGRITLPKARILIMETLNLSDQHTRQVEGQVLAKAQNQTPGHHPLPATSPPRWTRHHPRSDLPVPRLPHTRPPLRYRPRHPLQPGHRRRSDQRNQPRHEVPASPPDQTDSGLVGHAPSRRLHHLDHPQRASVPLRTTTPELPRATHNPPSVRPRRPPPF